MFTWQIRTFHIAPHGNHQVVRPCLAAQIGLVQPLFRELGEFRIGQEGQGAFGQMVLQLPDNEEVVRRILAYADSKGLMLEEMKNV